MHEIGELFCLGTLPVYGILPPSYVCVLFFNIASFHVVSCQFGSELISIPISITYENCTCMHNL